MISAFRRAADFRGESAVTTWLHRIVVNACLDRIRRRAARPAASGMDEQTLDVLAQGSALADPGVSKDTALDVLAALRTLAPEQRAVLVMVDMLGYPVADTAEILGVSPGTVKSRCARGRARLLPLLAHLRGSGRGSPPPGRPRPGRQPRRDSQRPGGTSQPHRASHQPRERVRTSHERACGRGVPGAVRRGSARQAPERADPLARGPLPAVRGHPGPADRGAGAARPGPHAPGAARDRGPAGRRAERRDRPPRRAGARDRAAARDRAGRHGARPAPGDHAHPRGSHPPARPPARPAPAYPGLGPGPGHGGRAGRRGRGGLRGGPVLPVRDVLVTGIRGGAVPALGESRRPLTGPPARPGRRHRPVHRAPQRDEVWEGHVRRAGCRPG